MAYIKTIHKTSREGSAVYGSAMLFVTLGSRFCLIFRPPAGTSEDTMLTLNGRRLQLRFVLFSPDRVHGSLRLQGSLLNRTAQIAEPRLLLAECQFWVCFTDVQVVLQRILSWRWLDRLYWRFFVATGHDVAAPEDSML